ncbi:hypothetical protein [Aureliella helgolandensis]|uniref:DUF4129 domain-containing protein n=1 Tax=Aureliella helgolandensis TaxID=2527968 RepID=A0A518G170_9BACT|nr:hypothetical protein [Aureliella helgolandensis]QDV22349.1 hypothetical protein Q31a_06330 [Aureliella helgolandensis]
MIRKSLLLLLLALLSVGGGLDIAQAESTQIDARSAWRAMPKTNWYDKKTEQYLPPEVAELQDNPLRSDGRQAAPEDSSSTSRTWADWWDSLDFGSGWGKVGTFLYYFLRVMVIVVIVVLVLAILSLLGWYSLRDYVPSRFQERDDAMNRKIDPARMVDLPFEVQQSVGDPLEAARAAMKDGDYSLGVLYLYGYMLLVLDRERKLHLQKGKTNRMYLKEVKTQPELHSILETTVLAFEDTFFGKHVIERERCLALWNQLDEFHQLATSVASPTVTQAVLAGV